MTASAKARGWRCQREEDHGKQKNRRDVENEELKQRKNKRKSESGDKKSQTKKGDALHEKRRGSKRKGVNGCLRTTISGGTLCHNVIGVQGGLSLKDRYILVQRGRVTKTKQESLRSAQVTKQQPLKRGKKRKEKTTGMNGGTHRGGQRRTCKSARQSGKKSSGTEKRQGNKMHQGARKERTKGERKFRWGPGRNISGWGVVGPLGEHEASLEKKKRLGPRKNIK